MKLTTSDKLTEFIDSVETAKEKLEELRETLKMETSDKIKEKIETESLEEANLLIEELSVFLKVKFECNAEEIAEYAKALNSNQKKEIKKYTISSFKKEEPKEKITKKEIELLKEIAEQGYFDQRQLKDESYEDLIGLNRKELLEIYEAKTLRGNTHQFRITSKGEKVYKEHFSKEIKKSVEEEIVKEFGSTVTGLLLHEVKEVLIENGYEIESIHNRSIEVMKDGVFLQLTPDYGVFEEKEYKEIMDKMNQLKRIGFVAETPEIMNKSMRAIEKWVEENKDKSRMLKIYFTNIQQLKEEEVFTIKKY